MPGFATSCENGTQLSMAKPGNSSRLYSSFIQLKYRSTKIQYQNEGKLIFSPPVVAIDLHSKSCIFLLSLTETDLTEADRATLCDTHHEMRIRLKQVKSAFDNLCFLRFSDEERKGRVTHVTGVIPGEKKKVLFYSPLISMNVSTFVGSL